MIKENYISWKKWDEGSFLKYSPEEAGYFRKELWGYLSGDKKNSILEIGFGNGHLIGWLLDGGMKVSGVEIEKTLVARAKENNIDSFSDIFEIVDVKYDLIIAFDVLEHIHASDLEQFFSKIKNLLNEGGLFVVRFPNGDSPFSLPTQNGDLTHVTSVGYHRVRYLSEISGLKMTEYRGERLYTKNLSKKIFRLAMSLIRTIVAEFLLRVFYPGMPKGTVSFKHINIVSVFKLER